MKCKRWCRHVWLDNFVYRVFHSEPTRFQLMCKHSSAWINVKQSVFEHYIAIEQHEEQKKDEDDERMEHFRQPIVIFTGD